MIFAFVMTETTDPQVGAPRWALTQVELDAFLRNVGEILAGKAVFRLESGGQPQVESFMAGQPSDYCNEPAKGLLGFFDTPAVLYMPATKENLARLADLSEKYAEPEFGNALAIYVDEQLILSWHDLPDDPVYVSTVVPESDISTFCRLVDCSYSREP